MMYVEGMMSTADTGESNAESLGAERANTAEFDASRELLQTPRKLDVTYPYHITTHTM